MRTHNVLNKFTHYRLETNKKDTVAQHSEDSDEMTQFATFHRSLHCLLR